MLKYFYQNYLPDVRKEMDVLPCCSQWEDTIQKECFCYKIFHFVMHSEMERKIIVKTCFQDSTLSINTYVHGEGETADWTVTLFGLQPDTILLPVLLEFPLLG